MKVYDFDGTIYEGDSTIDLFLFAIKKHKKLLLLVPKVIVIEFLFLLKLINKKKAKETLFSFLSILTKTEKEELVYEFWEKNIKKICNWYLKQKEENDVVISASPDFLLKPICDKLGISLISTKIDINTGKLIGENCYGKEKLKQYIKIFGNTIIDEFYTDSYSDISLQDISKKMFLIKNGKKIRIK